MAYQTTIIMTLTHNLVNCEEPEHAYALDLLDSKRRPGSAKTSSTEPDVATDQSMITASDHDATHEKQVPDMMQPDEYLSGPRLFFLILALVLSIFLVSLDMTVVATAIPKITDEFHGLNDVSWYSSAFFMTMGGFQSAWGKAYKYFSLETSFLTSIFIFELGSLLCGISPSSTVFIAGRAIAGAGAAGIGSGTYTIIAFSASPQKRPMFTGIIGTSYGLAAVVGPMIGGAFANGVTWRWCFYINLPLGAVSAFIILLFFKAPHVARPMAASLCEKLLQMDPLGATLVMGAAMSYILALNYGGQTYAWNSPQVIGLLVGFVLLAAAFTVWEWYQEDRAMVPFRLARDHVYLVASIFSFFFSGAYFLIIYYLPIYFQSIDDVSPEMSGVRNLPLILAVTISMVVSGVFISITGIATPIVVAGTAIGTVCMGLLYTLDIDTAGGKWIGYQIIGGVGWGLASQIPIITVQATAPAADLAEVTSILLFFQTIGGAFVVSAAQAAFVNVLLKVLPYSAPGVDPATVVSTGATDLRKVFSADQVPGILMAYMRGLKIAFAIGVAAGGVAFIIILFQRWNRLNIAAIPPSLSKAGCVGREGNRRG